MADAPIDYARLSEEVSGLGLHEHLCVIYENQEEQFAVALPYLRTGLERGEKCLYFSDEKIAGALLDALRKIGLDVDHYLRSGALTITHKRETDLQQGCFDPDWWIGFLNLAAAETRAAKFSVLRILGDMSWGLGDSNSTGKFIEFESRVNHFVIGHDARVICQYDRNRNSAELILGILRTHPGAILGGLVCKNPYYVPPEEFLKPNQAALEVERLVHNMLAWESAQEALRQSEKRLRLVIDTVPALIHAGPPDGSLDFFNQRWLDYVGLSLEDLLGWKWTALIHPEDVRAMVEGWHAALRTGEPYEHEARVRRADGEYRWMLHNDVPLRNERGEIVEWYASSIDIEDRKRAEEDLRRQKEILQKIFDNVPAMIRLVGPDGRTKLVNRAWERTMGWTLEEILAQDLDMFAELYPDPKYRQEVMKFVFSSSPEFAEFRTRVRDGRAIDTSWGSVLLSDGTAIGIGRDITERKRAEEELRRSEARWRAVFENSAVGIAQGDCISTRFQAANIAFQKMVGYTEEDLRTLSFIDITHEDERDANRQLLSELLEGKRQSFAMEKRYQRKDGSLIWVNLHLSLVPGTEDVPSLSLAIVEDITERKRAEEELRRSEARWRSVFENSAIGVALTDLDGHFLAINPIYQKMTGYTGMELQRLSFLDITQEDYREANRTLISELLEGKRLQFQIEKQYRRKDGSVIWVSNTVSLVPGTESVPRFIMVLSEDITERRKAEEDLQKSRDQLRALAARVQTVREEERKRVAREIHDELGQALTAIKIDLSSLCQEIPADKKKRSRSILKLVDETIQSVRRISTELRPAVLDAGGLVAAVEWAAGEFEARTRIKCRLDLPQADILIDQERATAVFRIFQETLTNVARHANATEVCVRLAEEDGNLALEVHDNGKGLGEAQLSAGGSLGILGMRERAMLLGGELTIIGSPGEGTTARARIPKSPPGPPKDAK